MQGIVYLLGNESMPGLFKIGFTRKAAADRAEELSKTTCMPTRFDLLVSALSDAPAQIEKQLHARYAHARVNQSREFFRLDGALLADAVDQIKAMRGAMLHWPLKRYLPSAWPTR